MFSNIFNLMLYVIIESLQYITLPIDGGPIVSNMAAVQRQLIGNICMCARILCVGMARVH